jgi:hypothetical protein
MKSILTSIHRFADCATAAVFALSLVGSALAQGSSTSAPPGAGLPSNINPRAEDRGRQLQERQLRSAELDAVAEPENQKLVRAAIVNMKEDFARIQVLRNDIARNLVAHKPLEYKLISEQTGEIHRRAGRLNVYMLAQVSDNDKQSNEIVKLQTEDMIAALVKLCKLVDSFTENPSLKNAGSIDVKQIEKAKEDKARADKDILAIIKLSENIKKKSDSLKP